MKTFLASCSWILVTAASRANGRDRKQISYIRGRQGWVRLWELPGPHNTSRLMPLRKTHYRLYSTMMFA